MSHLAPTPERIARAKDFLFARWRERRLENRELLVSLGSRNLPEEPRDLSGSCKFAALFAQGVFGGTIAGHYDHVFVHLHDGRVLDLNEDAADVRALTDPHRHDPFFVKSRDFRDSLETCRPRVAIWVEAFRASEAGQSTDA